ncbi:serine O-acetyltransferase [Olsenella uli]|uniref:serine O-acetyltransferase n=1 Tax=Olsenella uli TaxID=133926 RepID=UPI0012ABB965|nr:serine O-acetyltransferase [Olsenella uli]
MFDRIREDIRAFREHDPAATSTISILLNSPGMRAIWAYRRQHWWWTHGHPLIARTLSTWSRHRFGVEIHPGATIGRRFVIDHGMGIVVGETTIIGDDCQLYQGVTLGGTGKQSGKRHPTLGDNVVVGVGASVLGNVTLGNNVKVGGGAVVVRDVPADCTVVGVPGHVVTRGGVRVRSAAGERLTVIHNDSPATIDKVIREREDVEHREFLPDPLDNTVDDLQATVERLEKRVAELERMLMRVNDGRKGMPADQPTALAGRPARPEAYPPLEQQPSPTADASQATHEKE